jgi:hypothetical protein
LSADHRDIELDADRQQRVARRCRGSVNRSVRRLPVTATGRQLNDGEMAVSRLIQEIWGSQNTEAAVLFRDDEP